MTVSYNWLKEYVKFNLSPEEVERILTAIGLEVEGCEQVEEIPGGLAGVVVAHVLECVEHPDSDHLHVTKVDMGGPEPLQVVCGAPNVAAGKKVMLATLGTKLTFSDGTELKMKKSKIRGVESFGMLCAEDELGIGHNHEGIMILPDDAVPGTPAKDFLHLKIDTIYEIGLTPNRVDAASHIGVARDLSAYLKLNGLGGELTLPSVEEFDSKRRLSSGAIEVEVKAKEAAPRYTGITIKGVKVAESPEWLRTKLLTVGLRPINNIVDITNFVLMEMGQPLHAFDASKITSGKVVVDFCPEGTPFVTLDEVERKLSDKDLIICNGSEPMCLAGIFGGKESGVTESTTDVFLESAYFNPVFIRKSSKRHTLKTDASFRYERGCDPMINIYALKRAALLILELAGGELCGDLLDILSAPVEKRVVELDYARMERLIGKKIGGETIRRILEYLDMEFVSDSAEGAVVKVPTYRVDVTRECDVVEDVLRIYGYNNIELPEAMRVSINSTPKPDPERVKVLASELLAANGFMEIMNNSLTKSDYYAGLKSYPQERCTMIINPLSSDLNCMRQTLIFSALEVVAYNINRQMSDLKLFEFGNVYSYNAEAADAQGGRPIGPKENPQLRCYEEDPRLCLVITGNGSQQWRNRVEKGDFFMLKGYLELILKKFGANINAFEYGEAPADIFSDGFSFKLNGKEVAVMGAISPARAKKFGIKQPVFVAEIYWKQLLKIVKKNNVKYSELPKYPEVKRDLALLLNEDVTFNQILKAAFAAEKRVLKSVSLFDVYTGDKIEQGKKQYAVSFILQDMEKTLTDQAVDAIMAKLLKSFEEKLGAKLR